MTVLSSGDNYGGAGWGSTAHNHPGDKVVYETKGGQKLYASNTHSLKEYSGNWDLIIDLAAICRLEPSSNNYFIKRKSTKRFHALDVHTTTDKFTPIPSEVLALDWPDMGAPKCTLEFWTTLLGMLPAKTVVACIGGHGRTGTCLCSLMIADGVSIYDAVPHVRKEHCEKAVESLSQMDYLYNLYVGRLKRDIAAFKADPEAWDIKIIEELEKDLTYALENKPKSTPSKTVSYPTTSYGVKTVLVTDSHKVTTYNDGYVSNISLTAKEIKEERARLIEKGGKETEPYGHVFWEKLETPKDVVKPYGGKPDIITEVMMIGGKTETVYRREVPPPNEAAYLADRPSKVLDDMIFVKECIEPTCANLNCRRADHSDWVEWEFDGLEEEYGG